MIRCPRCHYPFLGLPEAHACPECGLDYDSNMKYIRLPLHVQKWAALGLSIFLIVMISVGVIAFGVTKKDVWVLLILFAFLVVSVTRFLKSGSDGAELIINRKGVHLTHPRHGERQIEWSRIASARCNWITGHLKVVDHADRTILFLSRRDLGGHVLARECAICINERLRKYA